MDNPQPRFSMRIRFNDYRNYGYNPERSRVRLKKIRNKGVNILLPDGIELKKI